MSLAAALLGVGAAASFALLFFLGANDVANSIGVSIGCGALTAPTAITIAATCNALGAALAGTHVSYTLSHSVAPILASAFDRPTTALAFLAALIAAALTILLGTILALPLSSTHAVVGAVAGAALATAGWHAVSWTAFQNIAIAWLVSPLVGGVLSFSVSMLLSYAHRTPSSRTIVMSFLNASTAAVVVAALVTSFQNAVLGSVTPWVLVVCTLFAAVIGCVLGLWLDRRGKLAQGSNGVNETMYGAAEQSPFRISDGHQIEDAQFDLNSPSFKALLIATVPAVAFAHGSNDVANGAGPFMAILRYFLAQQDPPQSGPPTRLMQIGILATGGLAIAAGLTLFGYRVIETVGGKGDDALLRVEWTYGSAFAAEFAAALSVLIASAYGMPVSTSHVIVGAVVGVGCMKSSGVNWTILTKVLVGGVATPIIAGLCSMAVVALLRGLV